MIIPFKPSRANGRIQNSNVCGCIHGHARMALPWIAYCMAWLDRQTVGFRVPWGSVFWHWHSHWHCVYLLGLALVLVWWTLVGCRLGWLHVLDSTLRVEKRGSWNHRCLVIEIQSESFSPFGSDVGGGKFAVWCYLDCVAIGLCGTGSEVADFVWIRAQRRNRS